jgi:hypothetical protein
MINVVTPDSLDITALPCVKMTANGLVADDGEPGESG